MSQIFRDGAKMKYPPRDITVEHLNWLYLIFNTDLPAAAKLLASYLNTYMNADRHTAWPSLGRIEQDCSLSRKTIIKHLGFLDGDGWLSKKHGGVINGRNTPNQYTMRLPPTIVSLKQCEPVKHTDRGSGAVPPHTDQNSIEVVEQLHPGSGAAPPKSEIESTKRLKERESIHEAPKKKTKTKVDPLTTIIADAVDMQAWADWWEYKPGNHPQITITKVSNMLVRYDQDQQRRMVDRSIANGWKGLFEEKQNGIGNGNDKSGGRRGTTLHHTLTDTTWADGFNL